MKTFLRLFLIAVLLSCSTHSYAQKEKTINYGEFTYVGSVKKKSPTGNGQLSCPGGKIQGQFNGWKLMDAKIPVGLASIEGNFEVTKNELILSKGNIICRNDAFQPIAPITLDAKTLMPKETKVKFIFDLNKLAPDFVSIIKVTDSKVQSFEEVVETTDDFFSSGLLKGQNFDYENGIVTVKFSDNSLVRYQGNSYTFITSQNDRIDYEEDVKGKESSFTITKRYSDKSGLRNIVISNGNMYIRKSTAANDKTRRGTVYTKFLENATNELGFTSWIDCNNGDWISAVESGVIINIPEKHTNTEVITALFTAQTLPTITFAKNSFAYLMRENIMIGRYLGNVLYNRQELINDMKKGKTAKLVSDYKKREKAIFLKADQEAILDYRGMHLFNYVVERVFGVQDYYKKDSQECFYNSNNGDKLTMLFSPGDGSLNSIWITKKYQDGSGFHDVRINLASTIILKSYKGDGTVMTGNSKTFGGNFPRESWVMYPNGDWLADNRNEQLGFGNELWGIIKLVEKTETFIDLLKIIFDSKTLPKLSIETKDNQIIFKANSSNHIIGIYANGSYTSESQVQANAKKKEQENLQAYNELCAKYGKKYVDAAAKGDLIVGMPEGLFGMVNYGFELSTDLGKSKKYYLHPRVRKLGLVEKNNIIGSCWVENGKVSSITWF